MINIALHGLRNIAEARADSESLEDSRQSFREINPFRFERAQGDFISSAEMPPPCGRLGPEPDGPMNKSKMFMVYVCEAWGLRSILFDVLRIGVSSLLSCYLNSCQSF